MYSLSIDLAANENISVRGHNVEVKSDLLFVRVTCVLKDQNEMKQHLKHEFGNNSPSLFDKDVMRKNTKMFLHADALKSNVTSLSVPLRNPYYLIIWWAVVIYRIKWSTGYTYDQVCDRYVRHVLKEFGTEVAVLFDGYREAMSTKVAEQ